MHLLISVLLTVIAVTSATHDCEWPPSTWERICWWWYYDTVECLCVEYPAGAGCCQTTNVYTTKQDCLEKCEWRYVNGEVLGPNCETAVNKSQCCDSDKYFFWNKNVGCCSELNSDECCSGNNCFKTMEDCRNVCGHDGDSSSTSSDSTKSGTKGTKSGTKGTKSGTKGTKFGTKGTKSGTKGTKSGTKGTKSDSKGTKSDTKGTKSGTKGTKSGTKGTKSGTNGTKSGTKGTKSRTKGTKSGTTSTKSGTKGTKSGTKGTKSGTTSTKSGTKGTKSGTTVTKSGTKGTKSGTKSDTSSTKTEPCSTPPTIFDRTCERWYYDKVKCICVQYPTGAGCCRTTNVYLSKDECLKKCELRYRNGYVLDPICDETVDKTPCCGVQDYYYYVNGACQKLDSAKGCYGKNCFSTMEECKNECH